MLQNESQWQNFSIDEVDVTVSYILPKKCFAETLSIFSLRWALEVTSGTDTRNGIGFMILSSTDRGLTPPLWLWFKLLLEVLWHLSFCKSEIKLFISSPTCLRCITMHLSERDVASRKYDLFVPLILESSLADTCCIWALSNVVETEPQNTQQKHMLFQMKQHGPFQGRNSTSLLVPCVVCEGFTEAERSGTPIAFFEKETTPSFNTFRVSVSEWCYDKSPQVLMHAQRLRNAKQSLENICLSFNL